MKVLHLNDHYERVGGAETILFNVLDALEERGITNVVVHQHPTTIKEHQRRLYQVPDFGNAEAQKVSKVAEVFRDILRDEQPDLVHIYDIGNPKVAEISSHLKPTVQSVFNHSFYCPGGAKYLPLLGRVCERPFGRGCLVSAFLTHCNSVRPRLLLSSYHRSRCMMKNNRGLVLLALSKYQAKCLLQNGYPSEAIKVLPPFTDLPPLQAWPAEHLNTLLFTGRVVPQKGLDVLLKSLKHLTVPFRLVVLGDGQDLGKARVLARELSLEDRVEFAGWAPKEKHLAYYRQASVVIVPSVWPEPFGMVGIEAMSYAKPVVAFNVGGIPEWLEDSVTGFLIRPYDMKKMVEKINFLLEHPTVAQEMGMKGRKKAEQEFCKEKPITRLLQIYKEVIDGRTQPSSSAH